MVFGFVGGWNFHSRLHFFVPNMESHSGRRPKNISCRICRSGSQLSFHYRNPHSRSYCDNRSSASLFKTRRSTRSGILRLVASCSCRRNSDGLRQWAHSDVPWNRNTLLSHLRTSGVSLTKNSISRSSSQIFRTWSICISLFALWNCSNLWSSWLHKSR
ncbi:MAG: Uncharacterised protein [Acidimicrobiaceae bacterium]|nr:MAG: Uncharacterised protein [Acidimicrobiaceae bacterium]